MRKNFIWVLLFVSILFQSAQGFAQVESTDPLENTLWFSPAKQEYIQFDAKGLAHVFSSGGIRLRYGDYDWGDGNGSLDINDYEFGLQFKGNKLMITDEEYNSLAYERAVSLPGASGEPAPKKRSRLNEAPIVVGGSSGPFIDPYASKSQAQELQVNSFEGTQWESSQGVFIFGAYDHIDYYNKETKKFSDGSYSCRRGKWVAYAEERRYTMDWNDGKPSIRDHDGNDLSVKKADIPGPYGREGAIDLVGSIWILDGLHFFFIDKNRVAAYRNGARANIKGAYLWDGAKGTARLGDLTIPLVWNKGYLCVQEAQKAVPLTRLANTKGGIRFPTNCNLEHVLGGTWRQLNGPTMFYMYGTNHIKVTDDRGVRTAVYAYNGFDFEMSVKEWDSDKIATMKGYLNQEGHIVIPEGKVAFSRISLR